MVDGNAIPTAYRAANAVLSTGSPTHWPNDLTDAPPPAPPGGWGEPRETDPPLNPNQLPARKTDDAGFSGPLVAQVAAAQTRMVERDGGPFSLPHFPGVGVGASVG